VTRTRFDFETVVALSFQVKQREGYLNGSSKMRIMEKRERRKVKMGM